MSKKIQTCLIIVVMLSLIVGCAPATPKVDTEKTKVAAEAVVAPTATVDTAATKQAEEKNAQATAQSATKAAEVKATEAAAASTATKVVQKTQTAEAKAAKTSTAVAKATTQAQDMAAAVTKLKDDGILKSAEGKYYHLKDFDEKWAQIGYYNLWGTGLAPSNFVVRAHTEWEMATNTPDPGGCGFGFRAKNNDNHYMIFLSNTGYVWFHMFQNGLYKKLANKYFDNQVGAIKGEADVMLVADGVKIYYFVNGKKALDIENQSFDSGALALSLISGTNKDYGTHCKMTNIEVWDLGE